MLIFGLDFNCFNVNGLLPKVVLLVKAEGAP